MRIAGTATYVPSATVVALRYHVDVALSAPKPGSRPRSMRLRASISEIVGSSSKITSTTGVREDGDEATAEPSPPPTSWETGDSARKDTRNTTGATASTVSVLRSGAKRT